MLHRQVPMQSYGPFLLPYSGDDFKLLARRYHIPDTPTGEYDGLTLLKMQGNIVMLADEQSRWMEMRPNWREEAQGTGRPAGVA